jgi:hypothetical protein
MSNLIAAYPEPAPLKKKTVCSAVKAEGLIKASTVISPIGVIKEEKFALYGNNCTYAFVPLNSN